LTEGENGGRSKD